MGNEINFNESLQRINDYLQAQQGSNSENQKTVNDVDIESIFAESSNNGEKDVDPLDFAIAFAEKFLEKEIDDSTELEENYLKSWQEIATYDEDDNSISLTEVQNVLDEYKESQLPDDWKVEDGVIKAPNGRIVEAAPTLKEGHYVDEDGKIVDKDGNVYGLVATIEKDTNGDDVNEIVESYYYYVEEEAEAQNDVGEKAVTKDEALANGNKVNDNGEIVDENGKVVGHVEVSYVDATGDGVTDKVTSYYLNTDDTEDETKLPDKWEKNDDGTITDDEGNNLGKRAVQADDIEAMGYTIGDDGYIYDKDNNKVGRTVEVGTDANGDGVIDTANECYLYADVEAERPDGFPEEWTINKDGTITDENGNVLGGKADDAKDLEEKGFIISEDGYIYPPDADTSDPANAVGRAYTVETEDGKYAQVCHLDAAYEAQNQALPDGLTKDADGTIKDKNGRTMTALDADDESLQNLKNEDGNYYNEFGQLVAITGEDGTVYKYDELPEMNLVAASKDEALPENYHIDESGNIIDDDTGYIVGRVEVQYDDATGDGVTDKITSYYIYEEEQVEEQGNEPSTDEAPSEAPSTEEAPSSSPSTEEAPAEAPSAEEAPSSSPSTEEAPSEAPSVEEAPSNSPSTEETPSEEPVPEEKVQEATISDEAAAMYAEQLYDATEARLGTDNKQVASILDNPDLNPADIAKIVYEYNKEHGSLINAIDGDFSGEDNVKYQNLIADSLLELAENGDEKALETLCKEFYNATEGKIGASAPFIEHIFEKASDNILAKLALKYAEVNDGADIFKAIKGDFSGSKKDTFIRKLNEALARQKE